MASALAGLRGLLPSVGRRTRTNSHALYSAEEGSDEPAFRPSSGSDPLSRLGLMIVGSQIVCEVSKQVCYYSLSYYNGGSYPVPRTAVVCSVELLKLFFTCVRLGCESVSGNQGT